MNRTPRAAAGVAAAGVAAGALGNAAPSICSLLPLRRATVRAPGTRAPGRVMLTFDDGPDPTTTPLLLDLLDELDVRVTFFLVGRRLVRCPDVARRMVAAGHEVAVHGWRHRPHLLLTPRAVAADIRLGVAAVQAHLGVRPRLWRPPHGILTGAGLLAARSAGLHPLLWTADGLDWRRSATPDSVHDRILGALGDVAENGSVVLLHDAPINGNGDSRPPGVLATRGLVGSLRERGWQLGIPPHGATAAR